jgi:hypothetical protein
VEEVSGAGWVSHHTRQTGQHITHNVITTTVLHGRQQRTGLIYWQ